MFNLNRHTTTYNATTTKVSCSSLNVKNFKANHLYTRYLVNLTDISYLNELWLKPNEVDLIKNITEKNVLFQSDMNESYRQGRPFGGQAWIINKSFKIINSDFLSRHISYVQIEASGLPIFLIGVYMPFDNSKKKDEALSMYELSLSLILTLLEKARLSNMTTLVVGDFNADFFRNKRFDKLLSQFVSGNNLISLDGINTQKIDHTFQTNTTEERYSSNIDHILIDQSSYDQLSLLDIQCNIQDDLANMSDHNAVIIELTFKHKTNYVAKTANNTRQNLDFEDQEVCDFYLNSINLSLNDLKNKPQHHSLNAQSCVDSYYSSITNILTNAYNASMTFQNIIRPQNNTNSRSKHTWFTWELREIKDRMVSIKKQMKLGHNRELETIIISLKKQFRRVQRQNIYFENIKNLNKFEKLAKENNKNKFWRFIKKNKKSRSNDKEISIPPSKVIEHYKNFFYEKYESLSHDQVMIKEHVNTHFKNYQSPPTLPLFKIESLSKILDDIESSNVQGNDKVTYALLKNARSDNFDSCLLEFFNMIIVMSAIPTKLNHSIIKPILKDQKKNTADTNNIRPLSISNCLAQIFERLILSHSPELYKAQKNQFGFRKNTSCNHAIFAVKETVFNYVQKKTSCKIASLDAEKAFDKVWRDGLFYKLKQKMNYTYWFLLKKYYDSSVGVILSPDFAMLGEFPINCGVKQGGVLSPFLFNIFIDELILNCLNANKGAIIGNINTSIIVYADDIILISPLDCHLQSLLDICTQFSKKWLLKFNPLKSHLISFGKSLFAETTFYLNNLPITPSNKITYLGIEINNNLDFNLTACEKFRKVQKSIFSLSYLGLTPNGVSPSLKSFLYKTYCLSQFTYALETSTLNTQTRTLLNTSQNNLIRQFVGLEKFCHMHELLKSLQILNFNDLYISSKLSFLESIKKNEICLSILNHLCLDLDKTPKKSKSFQKDILLLQAQFGIDIAVIFTKPLALRALIRQTFRETDGICDSVTFCLTNIKKKYYKNLLNYLIRPEFFQEYLDQMNEIIS